MTIHTFGDSHSCEGWNRIDGVNIHHIGPILCHSFGKEKLVRINIGRNKDVKQGDVVVFCLGEIDCRCHIAKYAAMNDDGMPVASSLEKVIGPLVENYMRAIALNMNTVPKGVRVGVYNVVPPARADPSHENAEYPFVGSDACRLAIVKTFNRMLAKACEKRMFTFIDVFDDYADEDGFLDPKTSDGHVHISSHEALLCKLEKLCIILPPPAKDTEPMKNVLDGDGTVIVVIDVWDKHWCHQFDYEMDEWVPQLNNLLTRARLAGISIIHAPCDVAERYFESDQRNNVRRKYKDTEGVPLPMRIEDAPTFPPLSASHACECGCSPCSVWSAIHPKIYVSPSDFIIDGNSGYELLRLMMGLRASNLVYTGVASNICVLDRPTGIRKMSSFVKNISMLKDATMAFPTKKTKETEDWIQKHVCPVVSIEDLLRTKEKL